MKPGSMLLIQYLHTQLIRYPHRNKMQNVGGTQETTPTLFPLLTQPTGELQWGVGSPAAEGDRESVVDC